MHVQNVLAQPLLADASAFRKIAYIRKEPTLRQGDTMVYMQSPRGSIHAILPARVVARLCDGWRLVHQEDAAIIRCHKHIKTKQPHK